MQGQTAAQPVLSTRKIAISGILAAIAILLGVTQIGFIPVPNVSGRATIMHVPVIIGAVMEGPLVGLLIGGIFGTFSFLQATSPIFKNPFVAIVPRLLIGVVAYYAYIGTRRPFGEYTALIVAGVMGTLTNTVLVLSTAVYFKLLPVELIPTIIPQAIVELILAAVITVLVVGGWKRIETGRGGSSL